MSAFWIVSACLTAGALLFLLPPLLQRSEPRRVIVRSETNLSVYRHQLEELRADVAAGALSAELFESGRRELERRMLQDVEAGGTRAYGPGGKLPAVLVGALLPMAAVLMYLQLGSPALIGGGRPAPGQGTTHPMDQEQIRQMVDGLARRLSTNPADPDGWLMLARSYTVLGRYADAATAYSRALALRPDDAQLLADYADTLAITQGKRLAGEPARLIQRALKADPGNLKALALAGSEAYERRDYRAAGDYWERLALRVPPGTDLQRSVQANLDEARALQAGGSPAQITRQSAAAQAPAGGRVAGTVRLGPALAARASAQDTVFVFARALNGPRMPLAILRRRVAELPFEFVLDDSLAMDARLKLSGMRDVAVGARISRSGNALPQPGDLQGLVQPVAVGASGVDIVIDAEVR